MEYTKDVMFDVEYDKKKSVLKFGNKKWGRKIIKTVKDNKIITIIVPFCLFFIVADCFLLTRFFEIAKTIN